MILIGIPVILLILAMAFSQCDTENLADLFFLVGTSWLFFGTVCLLGSWFYHASDLGIIRGGAGIVEIRIEHCIQLQSALKDTSDKNAIDSLAKAMGDLADARETVALAKVRIAQRAAGPCGVIVKLMGDK